MSKNKDKVFTVEVKVIREYRIQFEVDAPNEDDAESKASTEWRQHDFGLGETMDWEVTQVREN